MEEGRDKKRTKSFPAGRKVLEKTGGVQAFIMGGEGPGIEFRRNAESSRAFSIGSARCDEELGRHKEAQVVVELRRLHRNINNIVST